MRSSEHIVCCPALCHDPRITKGFSFNHMSDSKGQPRREENLGCPDSSSVICQILSYNYFGHTWFRKNLESHRRRAWQELSCISDFSTQTQINCAIYGFITSKSGPLLFPVSCNTMTLSCRFQGAFHHHVFFATWQSGNLPRQQPIA